MNELIKVRIMRELPNDQHIIHEVERNKIHLVCLALKKNNLAINLMVKSGLFDFDRFYSYCDLVNSKSEVGCFRPYIPVNLSLFPLHQIERTVDFESKKLVAYFNDTLIANQEYVFARKMVYVFDRGIWDGFNLEGVLKETVQHFSDKLKQQRINNHLIEIDFYCV